MMSLCERNAYVGVALTVLTMVLLVAKLIGANIGWWVVLSPIWMPIASLVILGVSFFTMAIGTVVMMFLFAGFQVFRESRKAKKGVR